MTAICADCGIDTALPRRLDKRGFADVPINAPPGWDALRILARKLSP